MECSGKEKAFGEWARMAWCGVVWCEECEEGQWERNFLGPGDRNEGVDKVGEGLLWSGLDGGEVGSWGEQSIFLWSGFKQSLWCGVYQNIKTS